MKAMFEMFEKSRENGSGVTLYFAGQSLTVVVTEVLGTEAIVGRNQQYSRVVIRLDGLIAVACN